VNYKLYITGYVQRNIIGEGHNEGTYAGYLYLQQATIITYVSSEGLVCVAPHCTYLQEGCLPEGITQGIFIPPDTHGT
jgi:hypothetical protein